MSDNFFSRWSRRKQGVDTQEPVQAEPAKTAPSVKPLAPGAQNSVGLSANVNAQPAVSPEPESQQPLPTMEDVQQLTPSSDYQGFMRQGVPGEVRNAAMKKLFTDPHFNVMDGLDIYIGDYNTPDPLPAGMLEKMVGAQLLNLFPPKTPETPPSMAGTAVLKNPAQSPAAPEDSPVVAQSPQSETPPTLQADPALQASVPTEHDDPDLQLQPNHAPASPSPGQSTG